MSQALVSQLQPGKVARVSLGPDDTVRGVRDSLTRVAGLLNVPIESWTDPANDKTLFVALKDEG